MVNIPTLPVMIIKEKSTVSSHSQNEGLNITVTPPH